MLFVEPGGQEVTTSTSSFPRRHNRGMITTSTIAQMGTINPASRDHENPHAFSAWPQAEPQGRTLWEHRAAR